MDTTRLKRFAQFARRSLIEQVSSKLNHIIAEDSVARRESAEAVNKLEQQIKEQGKQQVIEQVAYIWFNRFCALRFMDLNGYTTTAIVSPLEGQFQPEVLAEAKMGHIDEDMMPIAKTRNHVLTLLNGTSTSRDPQTEAYRLLLVAACNYWHGAMPFLFQRIQDYTELLLPDDLLSGKSILAYTREAMTPDVGQDVEVIGWLYQYYISEKKDEVFEGLKKNKKITPENIPAATQLFTPHWIVRYLVENSLGRLWMLNRPHSPLVERMEYYIKPEVPESDFLPIENPEEIKICDPACGSGHILVYAFDLLYAIYEEEGYEPSEIPGKILTHNLYGVEIDERAGELAAFALVMKAREKYRRFLRKPFQPNICVLQNVIFEKDELKRYMDFIGRDLFTYKVQSTLHEFEEADNFGSLIRPTATDVGGIVAMLKGKNVSGQLFLYQTHQKVLQVLKQADYLSSKYHVVVANPPYMGGKGMNSRLGAWVKDNYPDSKGDLFAVFIERNLQLARKHGLVAMITMQSWMFLSSFEKLRAGILGQDTLLSMAHLGARGFDSIGGEVVSTTAFVLANSNDSEYKGSYVRLVDGNSEGEKESALREAIKNPNCGWFFRASAADFKKIPGSPVAYWVSERVLHLFTQNALIERVASIRVGLDTGNNDFYIRDWSEVSFNTIGFGYKNNQDFFDSSKKYAPHTKGGTFRKWYGNNQHVLKFNSKSFHELENSGNHLPSRQFYFREGAGYTRISSSLFSIRYNPTGFTFNSASPTLFCEDHKKMLTCLGLLSSKLTFIFVSAMSPTLNFQAGEIRKIPFSIESDGAIIQTVSLLIEISKTDWDSYETSWDFTKLPLLDPSYRQTTLQTTYQKLRHQWQQTTLEMQRLEEENNRIFILAYGLQDELTPEVTLNEITLTCNPHYRYDHTKPQTELETLLLADTIKEYISYAVGCMFGRYSLDQPGLILANQGETLPDYLQQIPNPTFTPTKTNVIPILDGQWFTDDMSDRFRQFLRLTFGEEHYEENLKFIEKALGKDIRKYFLKDFYNDHIKRYKKRPIYWLFSSPKSNFNALIYLHRYRPDTVSIVLNDYLREFRAKLEARQNHLKRVEVSADASQSEKTKAVKEINKLATIIEELDDYEREILYPLAIEQIHIDLDDGVKANYPKFGLALKKIPGLETKEED
ncbi:BREX-1 system adenine-specific DNA-methyltransferase PglX [Cylindrospermopsis raciborskii CHAB3438]|uniref:BREX-1 system adenine-specific DNA-methyltransferase PglX n=1 Tax=Cylindrospermopsis raciborskii TaxID=77022 RepID=UPI001F116152|nr:BREX-1 system adenine-specific DNA-methyltransferase PglX [Cylindrospermopsis raciborskii]MCH4905401.1 BREX-1 system adenine-specific DNA-methyltransferase PglX [Cylindrospermopsis raciborskii CHAB3438]